MREKSIITLELYNSVMNGLTFQVEDSDLQIQSVLIRCNAGFDQNKLDFVEIPVPGNRSEVVGKES